MNAETGALQVFFQHSQFPTLHSTFPIPHSAFLFSLSPYVVAVVPYRYGVDKAAAADLDQDPYHRLYWRRGRAYGTSCVIPLAAYPLGRYLTAWGVQFLAVLAGTAEPAPRSL